MSLVFIFFGSIALIIFFIAANELGLWKKIFNSNKKTSKIKKNIVIVDSKKYNRIKKTKQVKKIKESKSKSTKKTIKKKTKIKQATLFE